MLKIKVPASSANLGPGFDVLALSFKLYNEFIFEDCDEIIIESPYEEFSNENNLVYKVFNQILTENNKKIKGIKISTGGDIPLSRGLGSSATCILAGVIAANHYLGDIMTEEEIYRKAVELEGHCDNITSQYFGGLTMSLVEDDNIFYKKFAMPKGIKCTALIPDYTLETRRARAVLPKKILLEDATYNLSHALLMIKSLEDGDFTNLKYFLKDKLHQNYRAPLVNNFHDIINKAYELGAYGSFLSGAGPTITVFRDENDDKFNKKLVSYLNTLKDNWTILDLEIDNNGTIISQE